LRDHDVVETRKGGRWKKEEEKGERNSSFPIQLIPYIPFPPWFFVERERERKRFTSYPEKHEVAEVCGGEGRQELFFSLEIIAVASDTLLQRSRCRL
jgi:hypothetical protein